MEILFTDRFKSKFNNLPKKIQEKFENRLEIFIKTPSHPLLKNHTLKGNLLGLRAFSITGDYRVLYRIVDRLTVKLIDIGTHNQVY
ncbi:MAG: type II toxin-antitoxin system RelE/ParE family toxin [Candidatus Gracilibacteria bacterium]|jgi:addiction module RelE/StbE family toxin